MAGIDGFPRRDYKVRSDAAIVGSLVSTAFAQRDLVRKDTLMKTNIWFATLAFGVGCCSVSMGQDPPRIDPTFSLEAVAVNGKPLAGGPVAKITIAPRDTVTAEIYVRDWSGTGDAVRAYQASLDRIGFNSGTAGSIEPVNFATTTMAGKQNKEHCFVSTDHPRYIFTGDQSFAITDTISESYRILGALVDTEKARVSQQDGTKFYCGTINLKASQDAVGSFTLNFLEGPAQSSLRNVDNQGIQFLSFERLVIDVQANSLRIVQSDPPDGAIDARQLGSDGSGSWDRVRLTFSQPPTDLTAGDFVIRDGTPNPPKITGVEASGDVLTLKLDRGIRPGVWTAVRHSRSGTGTRLACLPGDVDSNGVLDSADVIHLIDNATTLMTRPDYVVDVDRSGGNTPGDMLRIIDQMQTANTYRARLPG